MDSILDTIKQMLGITAEQKHFDTDIIILINSSLMKLNQIGIGPKEGFSIKNQEDKWIDFIGETKKYIEGVKSYVYLDVRLVFDTPTPHYVAEAYTNQAKELLFRLNIQIETNQIEGG